MVRYQRTSHCVGLPRAARRWHGRTPKRIPRLLLVAALTILFTPSHLAHAQNIHRYSIGVEWTADDYVGVRQYRLDRVPGGIPETGCTRPYSGSPVYQTQWVQDPNGANWVEIGTGHQCNSTFRYHFYGYGWNSTFYSLGWTQIWSDSYHTFDVHRRHGTTDYFWLIDGNIRTSLAWATSFERVAAGLESYADNANVYKYTGMNLEHRRYWWDSWFPWAGYDSNSVEYPLCGTWSSATDWVAGQYANCTY